MTMMEQDVAQIRSRSDLVRVIHALRADLQSDPDAWENPTLERFLDALAAWTEDMDGHYHARGAAVPKTPTWALIGAMLVAARGYE